ncbi:MAG TPA: redox-regulated ATPase YchF, partial [Flammeovirgaceae bacterium]|nr:redox-regulated ATPase YchF [Flammeovirgaceae bacterium]
AIIHVVRCFDDDNVVHVAGSVDPVFDKEVIDTELQMRDVESVEKKLQKLAKIAQSGDAAARAQVKVLEEVLQTLKAGKNVRVLDHSPEQREAYADLFLLTAKPVIYVANVAEDDITKGNEHVEALQAAIRDEDAKLIMVSAAIEAQIAELEDPEERALFLAEYGLQESGLSRLIRASYELLDLITYFTAGKQEVRAWTIKKGWKAPQAAGVIHTDFEKGFIKAEVIKLADYQKYKTEQAIKEAGKMAIEGKEYVVQDGDIMHFRFNV